ncbi:hypothetical protein Hanom_Chr03g00274511 [Helianthus anomalus]
MSVVGGISEVKGVENSKALVELLEIKLVDAATSVPVGISEAKDVGHGPLMKLIEIVVQFVINVLNWWQETHLEFVKVLKVTPVDARTYQITFEVSNGGRVMTYETKVVLPILKPESAISA